jgi:hypothetical protein
LNILLSLNGVLRAESGEPNRAGVILYYALNAGHRVAIITKDDKADAEHWLQSHGIIGYDDLLDNSVELAGEDLRQRQFRVSRHKAPIEMYVDSDPEMCAWVFEHQNVPTLLVSHPSHLPVEFRPDAPRKIRAWNEIENAITRVNIAKSKFAEKPKDFDLWQD